MENYAVRFVHLDLFAVHHKKPFLEIHSKEGHRIGLVIERDQMAVVREQRGILGIFTADREAEYLVEVSVVRINAEDNNRVVSCVGTDQILEIR